MTASTPRAPAHNPGPMPQPYGGNAFNLTESERAEAARRMRRGGSFATAISDAYFVADSDNEARLLRHFGHLFLKFHDESRIAKWRAETDAYGID